MKITDKRIIKALKAGKSIRRKEWDKGYVVDYNSYCGFFEWHEGNKGDCMIFRLNDIEANDWEIV